MMNTAAQKKEFRGLELENEKWKLMETIRRKERLLLGYSLTPL